MIPFPVSTLMQQPPSGSVITNLRKPAGDMQAGTDQRILAGDEAGNRRKTQETL